MPDIKTFEPLWGVWKTDELLGRGSFASVYSAHREDGEEFRSAIKHISIPENAGELSSLYAEGAATGEESAREYYRKLTDDLVNEIRYMYRLRGHSNVVAYEDHLVAEKKDMPGYDIFIRMELLRPLSETMLEKPLSEAEVIKLGLDICSALEALSRENIVHRDIKPANILVSADGTYKLGDFGVARQLEATRMVMSKKGTYAYMAPEVFRGDVAGRSADIYSLGLVMHRLLNGNRAPFLPTDGNIDYGETEKALARRLAGLQIPRPAYASEALGLVICRACAGKPEERYRTAADMRAALERCAAGAATGPAPAMDARPMPAAGSTSSTERSARVERIETIKQKDAAMTESLRKKYTEEKRAEKRRRAIVALSIVFGIVALAAAILIVIGRARRPGAPF